MAIHKRRVALAAVAAALWFALSASPASSGTFGVGQVHGVSAVAEALPTLDGANDFTGVAQRVAVIDTGIDFDHPGLGGRVVAGRNMAANAPWGSTAPADFDDRNGHGTFVAGVIGSEDPDRPGLAPAAEFVAVRVLAADGNGSLLDLALGLEWVAQNAAALNITTVNISIGVNSVFASPDDVPGWTSYRRIRDALDQLEAMNIVTAAAAGNDGSTEGLTAPAIFDAPISVGASNHSGGLAGFSNRNAELDLLAPGTSIRSLWKDGGVSVGSGTSFAAPQVAGTAVLLREVYEQFTTDLTGEFDSFTDRLVDLLQRTGVEVFDPASELTFQQIDLYAAVAEVHAEFNVPLPGPAVPEPATLAVFALGLAVLAGKRRA